MDEAITTTPVEVPLPAALRPYFVLQTEPGSAPPGSRFGGWWVTAWRACWPCVQIDTARSVRVGRTIVPAREGEPGVVEQLVAGSSLFVGSDRTWLDAAARAGVPALCVEDLVTTPFRRDLPLRDLHAAIERLAPGLFDRDASESGKCRARLQRWLTGRIADLGHGGHKIAPDAVGVDWFRYDDGDWIGDVRDLWFLGDESFDCVYSSHCLEDLWHPHQALREWLRILRPGGHLVLYLPLKDFYPNVGMPGANPGHKDDYVPEDVLRFLREVGGAEVVHGARVEAEDSFEIVARRSTSQAFTIGRLARPAPVVSVLVVGEVSHRPAADSLQLVATVAAAHRSLGAVEHEILVLSRQSFEGDALASVRDLGARIPGCEVVEDRGAKTYPRRIAMLAQRARGRYRLVLAPGTLATGDVLARLVAHAEGNGVAACRPKVVDAGGCPMPPPQDDGACLLLRADAWPAGLDASPYQTPALWRGLGAEVAGARVIGAARTESAFDESLLRRAVPPVGAGEPQHVVVVILRTMGDAILALPSIEALRARHLRARLTVVTEADYAWVFAYHPAIDEVRTVARSPASDSAGVEEAIVAAAVAALAPDRLVVLSDRQDHVAYHHSGRTLQQHYADMAGVLEAGEVRPQLVLAPGTRERVRALLDTFEVGGRYVTLHGNAGWREKSLPEELAVAIVTHVAERHGLPVVAVGGPGELVAHPMCLNLAGHVTAAESAALIAGAVLHVGVDSGPLHVASAFDVPTLGLYAGSSARVAPPLATRAISVQAEGSCALPCGRTPCREAMPCAQTLRIGQLRRALDALLSGAPVRGERHGGTRATWIHGPSGPSLRPGCEGLPTPKAPPVPAPRAPGDAVVAELGSACDPAAHAARALRSRLPVGPPSEHSFVRAAVAAELEVLAGLDGLDFLEALAVGAESRGLHELAVEYGEMALMQIGATVRGRRGRSRPAARGRATQVLYDAVRRCALAKLPPSRIEALLAACRRETGAPVPIGLLAAALQQRAEDFTIQPELCGALGAAKEATWDEALPAALLLQAGGELQAALDLLDAMRARLAPEHAALHAQLAFHRGLVLVAMPGRLREALAELDVAIQAGGEHELEARALRQRIERLLERRHLASAAR
jgi:ADP-heptose:LPS heptosyltransferase/SAM-dependent methyltransferase